MDSLRVLHALFGFENSFSFQILEIKVFTFLKKSINLRHVPSIFRFPIRALHWFVASQRKPLILILSRVI